MITSFAMRDLRRFINQRLCCSFSAKLNSASASVAIAKVCGATTIYSDDEDIKALGKTVKIAVTGLSALPLPPDKAQLDLQLTGPAESPKGSANVDD
jgi:hypothetical protein